MKTKVAIIIAFIIVIIFTYEFAQASAYRQILHGYWEAPLRFCTQAGLRSAQVYMQDDKMYVFMDTPTEVVCNGIVRVHISSKLASPGQSTHEWSMRIHDDSDPSPFPSAFSARFDPKGGMLGFYDGDTLYMELYKDSKATSGVS